MSKKIPVQFSQDKTHCAFLVPVKHREKISKLVNGEMYLIEVEEQRSAKSHRHYFAALKNAWQNLPEDLSEKFPTVEHLRHYALIMEGFRDDRHIVADTERQAQMIAAFVEPIDEFSAVEVSGRVVHIWKAKSQSEKAMGAEVFQRSKDAV